MKFYCLIASGLVLAGCATITRGTTNIVQIASNPPGATITTTLGETCGTAPCNMEVSRREPFTVRAELAGYEPAEVHVRSTLSGAGMGATAGNVLVGGLVGAVVDGASGATLTHKPNPVIVTLKPIDPANPATPPPGPPEDVALKEKERAKVNKALTDSTQ